MDVQELANVALEKLQALEHSAGEAESQLQEMHGKAEQHITGLDSKFHEVIDDAHTLKAGIEKMRAEQVTQRADAVKELQQLQETIRQFREDAVRELSQIQERLNETQEEISEMVDGFLADDLTSIGEELTAKMKSVQDDLQEKTNKATEHANTYIDRFKALNTMLDEARDKITDQSEHLKKEVEEERAHEISGFKEKIDPVEHEAEEFAEMLEHDGEATEKHAHEILEAAHHLMDEKVAHVHDVASKFHDEMQDKLDSLTSRAQAVIYAAEASTVSVDDLRQHWEQGVKVFHGAAEMLKKHK